MLVETQALTAELLAAGGWQPLTLDVTATEWATQRQAVLHFLGIDEVVVTLPALAAPLDAYVGTYAPEDPDGPFWPPP